MVNKTVYVFSVTLDNVNVRPIRIIADCYNSALNKFNKWALKQEKKGFKVIGIYESEFNVFE